MGDITKEQNVANRKTSFRKNAWVWLVPYNSKYVDVSGCVNKYGEIYWMQYVSFQTGDTGYIYIDSPENCIRYRFEVIGHDLPYTSEINREMEFNIYRKDVNAMKKHNRFALFRITGETHSNYLRLSNLLDQGLKRAPRGSQKLSNKDYVKLQKYIEEYF
ncbi:MAG: hypothetical protein J5720_05075 [Bacteroidaceae bacterium]|nr:hypothetical protein [Bacteroidaceae bacterium]